MGLQLRHDTTTKRDIRFGCRIFYEKSMQRTVMRSYNRINGTYAAENKKLLTEIFRKESGFEKIALQLGETKTVCFTLDKRAFAYLDTSLSDWYVESGDFEISLGQSLRNINCKKTIIVQSTMTLFTKYHLNTTIGDIMKDPLAKPFLDDILVACIMGDVNSTDGEGFGESADEMIQAMMGFLPVKAVLSFMDGSMTHEKLQGYIGQMNVAHRV